MNDPNKRIDVNVSSLLSLKAELLRKQDEVNKAKNSNLMQNFVPKKIQKSDPKIKVSNENIKTKKQTYTEYEETAQLAKSKQVLLAKSKLYDQMIKTGGNLNSDDNCLVMFNQKQQDYKAKTYDRSSSEDDFSDYDDDKYKSNNADEEWVEYKDCLGRTRKCMRKDLDHAKKQDMSLADDIQPRQEPEETPNWIIDTKGDEIEKDEFSDDEKINNNPENDLASVGMRQYQMRMQWEKQEMENMDKDYVHYQDILFDEARTHGVGFFEFSTDETERAKQRKELDDLRTETLIEQKKRDEQKKIREKLIAERVKAAKNRQRQRQGLPPEEELPVTVELYDKSEELKKKEIEEMEKLKKINTDKKRDRERKNHIRPWDEGKQQDYEKEWKLKIEKEPMSQDQWNTKKRNERPKNFAPTYEDEPIENSRSFNDLRRNKEQFINTEPIEDEKKSLFFTSKKTIPKKLDNQKFDKFIDSSKSNQIINELTDSDSEEENDHAPINQEFAPPPTYEYYGPSSSKHKKTIIPSKLTLEKSIEAGLKFLRNQSDKDSIGSKRKWTTNADY